MARKARPTSGNTPSAADLGDTQGLGLVGPPAEFTEIADWVALSGISPHAQALYWHLAMHERDGIQPTRTTLAARVQATPNQLSGYLAELVQIGAITTGGAQ